MKRKILAGALVGILLTAGLALIIGCATDAAGGGRGRGQIARPGVYITEMRGWNDTIVVETQVDRSRIRSVRVLSHRETLGMGTMAADIMPARIVAAQSLAVDTVTGGTVTANAIRAAVMDALVQAGANMPAFLAPPPALEPVNRTLDVDVVVVGAGGAGFAAAIEAQNELIRISGNQLKRRNVLVIEKQDTPGGNTIRSLGTWFATEAGTPSNIARINSGMEGGHWLSIREMLEYMIIHSSRIRPWLHANLVFPPRIMPPIHEGGCGKGLIMGMKNRFMQQQGILMYRVKATEILMRGNKAVGIKAIDLNNGGTITINAGAVVLATGGYGANLDKIAELNPAFEGFITNNSPGALGDGIWMAQAVGGAAIHMEHIQSVPTVYRGNRLILEWQRAFGGIFLNAEGRRFVNEPDFRDIVSNAIMEQGGSVALLFNEAILGGGDGLSLLEMGVLRPLHTLEEVAAFVGAPVANIRETVQKWNALVAVPQPARRAQDWIQPGTQFAGANDLSQGPWLAIFVSPGIHFTMGGVVTDIYTRVLREEGLSVTEIPGFNTNALGQTFNRDGIRVTGTPIPGLFAAGEVVGGIHGGNREGANAMLENQLFGIVAGYNAARFVNNLPPTCPFTR